MKKVALCVMLACVFSAQGQLINQDVHELTRMNQSQVRSEIAIPGFDGYQTMKCDFHIHTVFSDGSVWPDIRVHEAWQQGLDAIAITDHIEYRPNKEILKGDLNESFKIAKKAADGIGFIVIKGIEITRSKPLGHLNALFLNDAMPMDVEDPLKAIDEAKKQGAFVMWNHPGWPDDKSTLYPVHEQLINDKKINGIEVMNYMEYYPVSLDWCAQYGVAFMGNSDIHGLITGDYGNGKMARPLTLVFAAERSEKGIKEALFAGRTAALFDGKLAGRPAHLKSLLKASLLAKPVSDKLASVTNISDIPFTITYNGQLYIFPPQKTILIDIPKGGGDLVVENCLVGNGRKLTMTLEEWGEPLK